DRVVFQRGLGRRAAGQHYSFHRLHHQFDGLLADHLTDRLWLILEDLLFVFVFQMIHQHRSHETTVVGNGADGHGHLQRRDGEALAHRNLSDGDFIPTPHRVHRAASFPGRVMPVGSPKPKSRTYLWSLTSPSFIPTLAAPILEDFTTMSSTDRLPK